MSKGRIVDYHVLRAKSLMDLEELVKEKIEKEGWEPLGGICALKISDEEMSFYQAIVLRI